MSPPLTRPRLVSLFAGAGGLDLALHDVLDAETVAVADVPGVTWNETLKACGNGVFPAQAVAAVASLLVRLTAE